MSAADEVRKLVQPIAEVEIGTHSTQCYKWHVGCLAVEVLRLVGAGAEEEEES